MSHKCLYWIQCIFSLLSPILLELEKAHQCSCVGVFVQTSLLDLKEHASSLASSGLKKDSKLKSMEIAFEQKREECLKVENQLKRVRS